MKFRNRKYYLVLIFLLITNIIMVANLFLNSIMADAAISKKVNVFIVAVIVEVVLMMVVSALNYFTNKEQNKFKYDYAIHIRKIFFDNSVECENISNKEVENSIISRLTNDVDYIISNGVDKDFARINSFFGIFFPLIASSIIHISFFFVFPLSALISLFIVKKSSSRIEKLSYERSDSYNSFVKTIGKIFIGFQTFKLYNAYGIIKEKFSDVQMDIEEKKYKLNNSMAFYNSLIMVGMVLSQLIFIINAAVLVLYNKISPGSIIGLMGMAQSFFSNINMYIQTTMYIKSTRPVIDKMLEVNNGEKLTILDRTINSISVNNVSFSYDNKVIIDNFTYSFEKGKKYLIQGKSGAGKSTLLKLMSKQLIGYDGYIFYDNYDLKGISDISVKNNIGYIDQDVYIMNDTLENNITLGNKIDVTRLGFAIEKSNLKELYDTRKDIDVNTISGGQKQRIAIARAIYYNRPFILIDEAIKGLDKENAKVIEDNLLSLEGVAIIMISHNEVREEGKYDEILWLNGSKLS